jgi:hypothetical protein
MEYLAIFFNLVGLGCDIYGAYKLFHLKVKPLDVVDLPFRHHRQTTHSGDRIVLSQTKRIADEALEDLRGFVAGLNGQIRKINWENQQTHTGSKKWLRWLMAGFGFQALLLSFSCSAKKKLRSNGVCYPDCYPLK